MKRSLLALAAAVGCWATEKETTPPLLGVHRIYVEKLTGESSVQIRDMIINALQGTRLFVITENADRADASLKGSAEDLIFTDTFQSSDGINANASVAGLGTAVRTSSGSSGRRGPLSVSVGQQESTKIAERKHEAMAAVRLVDRNGDVIWSTTQESLGAKFKGASADVADKVIKQLMADIDKARTAQAIQSPAPESANKITQ